MQPSFSLVDKDIQVFMHGNSFSRQGFWTKARDTISNKVEHSIGGFTIYADVRRGDAHRYSKCHLAGINIAHLVVIIVFPLSSTTLPPISLSAFFTLQLSIHPSWIEKFPIYEWISSNYCLNWFSVLNNFINKAISSFLHIFDFIWLALGHLQHQPLFYVPVQRYFCCFWLVKTASYVIVLIRIVMHRLHNQYTYCHIFD